MNITWCTPKLHKDKITLSAQGIGIAINVARKLDMPKKVRIGYDTKERVIAIKTTSEDDTMGYSVAYMKGSVRVGTSKVINEIKKVFNVNIAKGKKLCFEPAYDEAGKFVYVHIDKPEVDSQD